MRVGVDVSILSSPLTGIGRFALSLVQSLTCLPEPGQWVLLGAPSHFEGLPEAKNVTVHQVQGLMGWRRIAWQQIELPRLAGRYHVDVLHCPDFSRPIHASVPVVNTIHDLSYYSPHAYFSWSNRTYKRALTRIAVGKSSRLVADSNFTRDELLGKFRLDNGVLSVVYLGVDQNPPGEPLREENPYVLYVGTLEERKNLPNLIQGFALMRRQKGVPHRLILAGKPGKDFERIQAAIEASDCKASIEITGYVSQERVIQLYRAANLFIMPSLYEGFGLPVLEAMATGIPVVCSRAASLPEVGGDAAEYFDPLSPQEIAAALAKVLGSESLRAEMRRKGLERAKLFSWDECARRYCKVYKEVASG
ncbi:MAG TPA: glycosyltransferase family 1 protein [Terriglobia bacterium]|nr:glycosyltransferase family 1 protein [Terriglobia bacterium]